MGPNDGNDHRRACGPSSFRRSAARPAGAVLGAGRGAALAVALAIACACAGPAAAETKAVVTIKPIHSLVARVMEGIGSPALLISGSASPHTYALKPSDARSLNSADVFFRVSEQVEPFTGRIVKSLPKSVRVVTLSEAAGVELLAKRTGDTFETHDEHGHDNEKDAESHSKGHDKADDHGASKSGAKPEHSGGHDADHEDRADHDEHELGAARDGHVWLDPQNAKAMVGAIVKALSEASPADTAKLEANAARLIADLDALEAEIARSLEPAKGRPFVVFHDAFQYFERRFGLTAVGSITVSPDVQPSARRLTEIRKKIAGLGAACVFAEPGFSPRLVATVTEGTPARAGTLDPEGLAIKDGPNAYFDLMRGLGAGLKSCLVEGS